MPDDLEYRQIPGYPAHYEACSDGTIWSRYERRGKRRGGALGTTRHRLTVNMASGGRAQVTVTLPCGKRAWRRVAILVLTAFRGSRPSGMQCCHNDGDRSNDTVANLRWDTPESNSADRVLHGTNKHERNGRAKLSRADAIFVLTHRHIAAQELAERYGVTKQTIRNVWAGETWAGLNG